jgi:hypothetical protein
VFTNVGVPDKLALVVPADREVIQLYVDRPTLFQTPRQKLLVAGGREELRISVPSLCHCANPASVTIPPMVNFDLQKPTIGSTSEWSSSSETSKNEACLNSAAPRDDCCCQNDGRIFGAEYPQSALA